MGFTRRFALRGFVAAAVVSAALLATTFAAGGSYAFSDEAPSETEGAALSAPPASPEGTELTANRTATSDSFRLPGGERETRMYGAPINYRDEEGNWQPIEEGLEETASGAITNGDNSFDVQLPQSLDRSPVRLTTGDSWVAERPLGINTETAELEGEVANYEPQGSGIGLEFSGLANGLKEKIELAGPSSPSTLHFEVEASPGLSASLGPEGAVQFQDEAGHLVTEMPPPAMYDSAAVPNVSNAVHYGLEADGQGKWKLTVEADREWLSQPNRAWPVTIDPSVTVPTTTQDCSIFNGPYSEYNVCGNNGFPTNGVDALYKSSGEDEYGRLLLQFDLSSIPSTASISSATVGVYASSKATNTAGVGLFNVTHSWSTTVNWLHYELPNKPNTVWATPGGDYATPDAGRVETSKRGAEAGWWNFTGQPLTWLVQRWLSGSLPNDGVLLKLLDETSHQCSPSCIERRIEFATNAAANKPYLSVNYFLPAPKGSEVTSPSDGTRSAKRYKLQAAWTHEGVEGVTFQYQSPEGWLNVPEAKVTNAKGEAIKWPLPVKATDRTTEPLYWNAPEKGIPNAIIKGHIRAVLAGTETAQGYTQPVEAQLNRDLGGPKDALTQIGPGTVDLLTGNFTVSNTDVSIPVFNSSLEFSRSFNSRAAKTEEKGVLGPGWVPGSPVEEAGESAWKSIRKVEETETYIEYVENEEGVEEEKPETITYHYAIATTLEGEELAFEEGPGPTFVTPPEMSGWSLGEESPGNLVLSEPGGSRTVFENHEGDNEYVPVRISQPGGPGNKSQLEYEFPEKGKKRLKMVVAPSPPGLTCTTSNATTQEGCHALTFTYTSTANGDRLTGITYYAPGNGGWWEVARYVYNSEGRLIEEYDPRISPKLAETYSYQSGGQIKTITPPGQEPWTMEYGTTKEDELNDGRLIAVKRPSLLSSPATAKTTIAYEVPISGSGAPYGMGLAAVSEWGQTDVPLDATAVFPPSEEPSSPPGSYGQATVYYMDAEGHLVNTATPSGAGTSAPSISTSETDQFGNVVRELTPQNRLRALETGTGSVAKSHGLETKRVYSPDGTELLEATGPKHQIRLASGSSVEGRAHQVLVYDEEMPPGLTPDPHLPTTETSGALVGSEFLEQHVTKHKYNWTLRKPTETIVDPSGLNIRSVTSYNETTGLPIESRQPRSAEQPNSAGTTKTVYYYGDQHEGGFGECLSEKYSGLPCRTEPAAQPGTAGMPQLLVKKYPAYNALGEPTEVIESPGGEAGNVRKTVATYDAAGRPLTKKIEGGGAEVPKVKTEYSPTLGLPSGQSFVCESECGPGGIYQGSFGSSGSGNGKFNHPADLGFDSKGNVWVLDKGNNRIEEFNEKGVFIRPAGSEGSTGGKLKAPSALAVDPSNNVWVADTANNRGEEFNEKGEFVAVIGKDVNKTKVEAAGTEAERNYCSAASGNVCQAGPEGSAPGQLKAPQGIAATSSGNIWVADTGHSRMEKYTPTGGLLNNSFSKGSGVGQVNEPTAVAMGPAGSLWIADTGNNRIEHWDSSLSNPAVFGSEGTGNGQFKHPDALDVSPVGGYIWVGDEGNNRVEEFNEAGGFLGKFGSAGSGNGQFSFSAPIGIAGESKGNGNIWATDPGNNRVEKWALTNGFDSQATATTYDKLGRAKEYRDADGNISQITYDVDGRPVTTTDNKGSQTMTYDPTSGLPTKLEDSAAGTFTASFDADGNLVERGLPNGLTAKTTYNEADEPTKLAYTKTSFCGESCTWLEETLERSVSGQIVTDNGTLAYDAYFYDQAGRLTEARETATGGCTTRAYRFEGAAGLDSNRTSMATRSPGIGGACVTSGGAEQKYKYDEADRLEGPTYDAFGRITSLPAEFAGGKSLTTTYYGTDMVATQTQNGVSNSYELDASMRQRARLQNSGLEGVEVFHYDGGSDSPAWTEHGSTWTRNVVGIGGELAAIQESGSGIMFELTNLHGDVVATAESSPTATKLKATFRFDEFGNPMSGSAGRFGWLGGKQRRTELASGVIQMGVRSYVPEIGRFLSTDPVPGGSANAYDYANADPVTGFDLLGETGAKACYPGVIGCQCVLWSHLKKGAKRGTMTLTVVQKCNRFGGITYRGGETRWAVRGPQSSFHSIRPPAPVYPSIKPACTEVSNACQNYQKYEDTLHCEIGKEYQYTRVWGFRFNYQGNGEDHNLGVTVHVRC